MKTLVRIISQYRENYGSPSAPHWKNKSGVEFQVRMDNTMLMYDGDNCVKAFKRMLKRHSNEMCQYLYVSHELVFHKPVELCTTAEVEEMVMAIANEPEIPLSTLHNWINLRGMREQGHQATSRGVGAHGQRGCYTRGCEVFVPLRFNLKGVDLSGCA